MFVKRIIIKIVVPYKPNRIAYFLSSSTTSATIVLVDDGAYVGEIVRVSKCTTLRPPSIVVDRFCGRCRRSSATRTLPLLIIQMINQEFPVHVQSPVSTIFSVSTMCEWVVSSFLTYSHYYCCSCYYSLSSEELVFASRPPWPPQRRLEVGRNDGRRVARGTDESRATSSCSLTSLLYL